MSRGAAAVEGLSVARRSGAHRGSDELFEESLRRPGDLHNGVIEGGCIPTGRDVDARHLSDELQSCQVQLLIAGERVLLAKVLDVAAHRTYLTKPAPWTRREPIGCLRSTGTRRPVRPKPPPGPAREGAGC